MEIGEDFGTRYLNSVGLLTNDGRKKSGFHAFRYYEAELSAAGIMVEVRGFDTLTSCLPVLSGRQDEHSNKVYILEHFIDRQIRQTAV